MKMMMMMRRRRRRMMMMGKVCCEYTSRSNVLGTEEVDGRCHGNATEIGGSRVERDGEWEAG